MTSSALKPKCTRRSRPEAFVFFHLIRNWSASSAGGTALPGTGKTANQIQQQCTIISVSTVAVPPAWIPGCLFCGAGLGWGKHRKFLSSFPWSREVDAIHHKRLKSSRSTRSLQCKVFYIWTRLDIDPTVYLGDLMILSRFSRPHTKHQAFEFVLQCQTSHLGVSIARLLVARYLSLTRSEMHCVFMTWFFSCWVSATEHPGI